MANNSQFCCNIFEGSGETVESSSYVFVTERKTWSEVQSYCRQFYTDLVSVRNQSEYEEIKKLTQNQSVWIGLHRDSWKWSDGSPTSFKKWIPPYNSQIVYINTPCVVLHKGQWGAHTCEDELIFACQSGDLLGTNLIHILIQYFRQPCSLPWKCCMYCVINIKMLIFSLKNGRDSADCESESN